MIQCLSKKIIDFFYKISDVYTLDLLKLFEVKYYSSSIFFRENITQVLEVLDVKMCLNALIF